MIQTGLSYAFPIPTHVYYPDVTWKEGKLLNRASKKELETWVKEIDSL